ncbi:CtsR family transcriptional regulator [Caldinitratiruptor microaerophilus]|uniref:CtsR family transcriptional regulator n=1 Tax=Caldinitratiruptor microaerophilus TaxID=671077 RepID=A0AA35CMW2_9FIRM|nr:CtsR family transcriptional regulator [Caldinitratiruptor microaerophilus]BDG62117.1 CtsR family transcriptional regulator [Caldinitratiruptor microaerophilus]
MANLADLIEDFLKEQLRQQRSIEVRRASLAERFGCAPSQINYVLATRFTPARGYVVESRRGGGGYIRIVRLELGPEDLRSLVLERIGDELSQDEAVDIIRGLRENGLVTDREAAVMEAAVSRETLGLGLPLRDIVRARLVKAMVLAALRA